MIAGSRARFSLRRIVATAIKRVPLPLPFPARVALVRRLSSSLLIQAVGNLEGRDELFWLRKEVWDQAHQVLGITPSRDRFTDTGWEFGLETGVAHILFMPLLASAYRRRRDRHLAAWLDEFVTNRWVDCVRSSLHMRALERTERSRAADIDRRMRSHVVRNNGHPVLRSLSSLLADTGFSEKGGVGLVVTRPGSLESSHYAPVLGRLRARGLSVLWLAVDPEAQGEAVRAREHPWGLEVSLPLPAPQELLFVDPGGRADYGRLLETVEVGFRRLPDRRNLVAPATYKLAAFVYRWLAATLVARRVCDLVSPRFVDVRADKDVEARAFVVEARKRGVPCFYYYGSLALGAPSYWPFSDRILASNGARAECLIEHLGVPGWRIEPVGEMELNEVVGQMRENARSRTFDSDRRLVFLMKWPAEIFLGRPEEILELLRELAQVEASWTYVLRPHPRDPYDYRWLEQALPGRIRISGSKYGDSAGLAEAIASSALVVTVLSNAAYPAIAAGKPTIIYNPDPKTNLGHDRLFARDDLPRQLRLVTDRDELVRLLRRVIGGEERDLLAPEPLKPSLVRYLFHSLDGRTADRIAEGLLKSCEVTRRP